jgi:hypothetical protein
MEIPKLVRAGNLGAQKPHAQTRLGEYDGGAESACARAMAEAERLLRELSPATLCGRRLSPLRSSIADEKAEDAISSFKSIGAMPDCFLLDPGLDFVVHNGGMIDLTEAGFRRMGRAHAAGLHAVIGVDGRDVLRFPAPEPGCGHPLPQEIGRVVKKMAHGLAFPKPLAELLEAERTNEIGHDDDQ